MSHSLSSRLEKLEERLKVFSKSSVWVDMVDNRIRVDINHERGEELTFDSVYDCLAWADQQLAQFENITGMGYIDDISQVLEEGFLRDLFNRIYEGAKYKNVAIAFNKLYGRPIADAALATWWWFMSRDQEWRQAVEARADALIQSWGDTAAMLS
jgi:hypothetical protein